MALYRLGRILQGLALLDVAFALFFAGSIPVLGGMAAQFQIVLLAGALFGAGRFFQTKGEARLRAAGLIPASDDSPQGQSDPGNPGEESGRS
ncbi:MAG: hypothetical protein HOJ95_07355 [Nitrospinaceae bacterium]|nr:hypothetical protein [Nitrospinaceae bacterium]